MGELGDYYRDWKEHRKEKKAQYQANDLPGDMELLGKLDGVTFEEKNNGEHFILSVTTDRGVRTIDYWPSTGFWKVRGGKASGARITHLQRYFKLQVKGV